MIQYNSKQWFTFIFRFHKSDTIRQLIPLIIGIAVYSAAVAYLEISYWKLSDKSYVKGLPVMHGLLSFVISMLLVFRTNTAYDRWWEGRKLWGSLVNNSRNLALKLSVILQKDDAVNRAFFSKTISAYAFALKNHLGHESTRIELFDTEHAYLQDAIEHDKHVPNQVVKMLMDRIQSLKQQGLILPEEYLSLTEELRSFTDICGGCERIKNTPIPFSYSTFLKKFIFFYVMTLPFGYVFSLGYLVVPVVCFIFYVLASLELIAEEIEEPFGGDANDLPTAKISKTIHHNVADILV